MYITSLADRVDHRLTHTAHQTAIRAGVTGKSGCARGLEVIPAAQEYGLGVTPLVTAARRAGRWDQEGGRGWAPGVRAGRRRPGRPDRTRADPVLRGLPEKHGGQPVEAAPAWLLTRPGGTGPSVGPRTAEQLDSAIPAVELEPSEDLLEGLDEISPAPGRGRGRPGGLRPVGPGGAQGQGEPRVRPPRARTRGRRAAPAPTYRAPRPARRRRTSTQAHRP